MEKGKRGQITNLVIIVLSVAILISGILLVMNISKVTAALPSPKEYDFLASVYPEKAQLGTVFTIKATLGINRTQVYRIDAEVTKDNKVLAEIPLIDDGMHGDEKADDGIYANVFDSTGYDEGVYNVNLKINPIENINSYKNTAEFQVFKQSCVNLRYTGNPSDKIDVVFLPSGYTDMSKFESDVLKFLDFSGKNKGLFALEPFKSNADKFNIYLVNESDNLGCNLGCQGIDSMICCNDNKVSEFASQCPSDQIVVIQDTKEFCGTASYYAKVCAISRGAEVFTHEFGHSFGGLGDEYDYSAYYPTYKAEQYDYPNCDSSGCPKWSNLDLEGISCSKGCGVSNAYKPTDCDCEMCNYVGHYDSVCSLAFRLLMDKYTPSISENELAPPIEKSYMIDLNDNNDKLSLNNVYLTQATAPDRKTARQEYKARLVSFSGQELYTFDFEMPKTDYPFFNPDNDTIRPSPIAYDDVNRIIAAPYYSNAKKMEVYNLLGKKILEVDLARFSNMCGDNICEINENHEQCPADCSVSKKDKVCTYQSDNVCDPDCLSIDSDCKKLSPLLIANIVAFSVFIILFALILARKR